MYITQIRNKLTRQEEDMEDLLTGNVFGLWRYLPHQLGLIQFLETSQDLDGDMFTLPEDIESVNITFWPWLKEEGTKGAQPDVMIEIKTATHGAWLILIESKYLSGKSSLPDGGEEPNDQLAREMNNLRRVSKEKNTENYALLFITAHTVMPKWEMEESVEELTSTTCDGSRGHFYWTTWRRLPMILQEQKSNCSPPFSIMLRDLDTIISRLGLTLFENISYAGWTLDESLWRFAQEIRSFTWQTISMPFEYSFRPAELRFNWDDGIQLKNISWRWDFNE